jgi:hypothetical protein
LSPPARVSGVSGARSGAAPFGGSALGGSVLYSFKIRRPKRRLSIIDRLAAVSCAMKPLFILEVANTNDQTRDIGKTS